MSVVMHVDERLFTETMQKQFPRSFSLAGLECLYEHLCEVSEGANEDFIFKPAQVATSFHEYSEKELFEEWPLLLDYMDVHDVLRSLEDDDIEELLRFYGYDDEPDFSYDFLCANAKPEHLYVRFVKDDEELFLDFLEYGVIPVLFDNGAIPVHDPYVETRWIVPSEFDPR